MQIGNIVLQNPVVAAPMAGITDKTYRQLIKQFHCALTYTEMVSATALIHQNKRTYSLFDVEGEEGITGVQLFGSEPDTLAKAAAIVEERGIPLLDINMGCPTPKIVKNNEGAALMKDPSRIKKILKAVIKVVNIPVTVKIRSGWSPDQMNAVEIAMIAEGEGVSAVTVHGRTRCQFYSGKADRGIIKQVKEKVHIPVIGNGDIWTPQDAKSMMEDTGCDFIMVARGGLGNPWLYGQIVHYLNTGVVLPPPEPAERIAMGLTHFTKVLEEKSEDVVVRQMRKHLSWYFKGLRNAARMREEINKVDKAETVIDMLKAYIEGHHHVRN